MGNFACKAIAVLCTGTVLLFVSPRNAVGQTWTTADTNATVNVSNGANTGLNPPGGTITADNGFVFGNAGHTLTITDNG